MAEGKRGSKKTTLQINIDRELKTRAKIKAIKEGTTLTAVIARLLAGWLKEG